MNHETQNFKTQNHISYLRGYYAVRAVTAGDKYMEEWSKTTSPNSLSLHDLMLVEKSWFGEHHVSRSELNDNFNNNKDLSAELRELLK